MARCALALLLLAPCAAIEDSSALTQSRATKVELLGPSAVKVGMLTSELLGPIVEDRPLANVPIQFLPPGEEITNAEDRPLANVPIQFRPPGEEITNAVAPTSSSKTGVCCCKQWGKQSLHPWWSQGMSCSRTGDKPGIVLEGGTKCCKERPKRCDWRVGYNVPLAKATKLGASVPGCGADFKSPGDMPRLSRQDAIKTVFDVKAQGKLTDVKGPWDGGWMFYFGIANGARGVASKAATELVGLAEGVGQTVAEGVGQAAAPVALAFGGVGLITAEKQINEMKKNLNLDLAPTQRAYIECKINDQRTNQKVTVLVMAIGVIGIATAPGTAGLGTIAAGVTGLTITIANKIRGYFFACKAEDKKMKEWVEKNEDTMEAALAQVLGFSEKASSNGRVCCCKKWGKQSLHPWWSQGMSCSRTGDKPGIVLEGGTKCCKERPKRCDWRVGYNVPLAEATKLGMKRVPGCGADFKSPGDMPRLSRQDATINVFDVKAQGKLTNVKGPWDGGWMFYFGIANGARGVGSKAATEVVGLAEGVGQTVAEGAGQGAAPVALAFGGVGLMTAEKQINEMKKNLNLDLAPTQRAYIECKIRDQRTNQKVTVLVMGIGVIGIATAPGTAGLGTIAAGVAGLTITIANKVRGYFFACKAEDEKMKEWVEDNEATMEAALAQVLGFAEQNDPNVRAALQ